MGAVVPRVLVPPAFRSLAEAGAMRARQLTAEDSRRSVPSLDALLRSAPGKKATLKFGRPLVKHALQAILSQIRTEAARGGRTYSDLEVERETGSRGRRTSHAEAFLVALTGAEDALVVNNNAAALLLALAALAQKKEVLVSRGELIEIGGEFRLPEIMAASGAKLIEVGTTNRTHADDYARAVNSKTALILKVHPSNYPVVGFTNIVPLR